MARTSLTADQLFRLDRGDTRENVRAKLAEHDTALDALESVATGKGASLVGVEDDAGIFDGDNVEECLAEVKEIADALALAGAALLTADAITADASGRAVFQNDLLDAATVARVVDAKAIDTGSIADSAIETLQINDGAVTQPKLAAVLCGAPSARAGAGAIALTAPTCLYSSAGPAEALTVADATAAGHRVRIVHVSDGGSGVITQTTGAKLTAGIATITLADPFDWIELEWSGSLWNPIAWGGAGLVIATA